MSDTRTLLNAQEKLGEIKARLAALQELFNWQGVNKEFGSSGCFGIDLTIGTIVDELDGNLVSR